MLIISQSNWNVETLAQYGYLLTKSDFDAAFSALDSTDQMYYICSLSDQYQWPRPHKAEPDTVPAFIANADLSNVRPTEYHRF